MWRKGSAFVRLVGMQIAAATVESSKLNMDLPLDPAIPLLGIYLKEPKTLIRKNISSLMFIATLFTITKIRKCPSTSVDERIKQQWDIYTMEHYLAVKRRKFYPL